MYIVNIKVYIVIKNLWDWLIYSYLNFILNQFSKIVEFFSINTKIVKIILCNTIKCIIIILEDTSDCDYFAVITILSRSQCNWLYS